MFFVHVLYFIQFQVLKFKIFIKNWMIKNDFNATYYMNFVIFILILVDIDVLLFSNINTFTVSKLTWTKMMNTYYGNNYHIYSQETLAPNKRAFLIFFTCLLNKGGS